MKTTIKKEKLKALEATLGNIEKAYGKGSIMKLGDEAIDTVSSISSGSISLDNALGIGGVPKGRVVEIGQHEDLMNNKNLYYNLYKLKMQDPVTLGEK